MKKDSDFSTFLLRNFMLLTLFSIAWSPGLINQYKTQAVAQSKIDKPPSKITEHSIFTVIEIEDLEYPKLEVDIRLPYRVNPKNTVVLGANHAYATTERHLHVIDVSKPYLPSYQTSLAFQDEIGKVVAYGNRLVVAGDKEFHIIDISVPTKPVIQSTTKLPNKNRIKDIDVQNQHLYILAEDNYSLYIFSLEFRQPRFVKSDKLAKRWWLLCPSATSPKMQQIQFPSGRDRYSTLLEPLLAQRRFLQLHPSAHGIIRSSDEFLVSTDFSSKANDLPIKREMLRKHIGGLSVIDACWIDEVRKSNRIGPTAIYNVKRKYRENFFDEGKKTLKRHKPKISNTIINGKMQQIASNPLIETVEINNKTYEGQITDYQISGNLIYIVSDKGFFSVFHFFSIEEMGPGKLGKVLSTIPLQASQPISIAVGKHHAYVLARTPIKEK